MNLAKLNRYEERKFRKIAEKCIAVITKQLPDISFGQGKWLCEFLASIACYFHGSARR